MAANRWWFRKSVGPVDKQERTRAPIGSPDRATRDVTNVTDVHQYFGVPATGLHFWNRQSGEGKSSKSTS